MKWEGQGLIILHITEEETKAVRDEIISQCHTVANSASDSKFRGPTILPYSGLFSQLKNENIYFFFPSGI